jgi:hypothetical protein
MPSFAFLVCDIGHTNTIIGILDFNNRGDTWQSNTLTARIRVM